MIFLKKNRVPFFKNRCYFYFQSKFSYDVCFYLFYKIVNERGKKIKYCVWNNKKFSLTEENKFKKVDLKKKYHFFKQENATQK